MALVALLFALIVVIELATPIFGSKWYMTGDLGNLYRITNVPGQAVKNLLQGDPYSQINPDLKLDVQSVRSGHLPTWNSLNGNGEPFLATAIPATFSPFTVPFYLLPFGVALVVSAGLKLWCLAFFTFLWLRRLLKNDLAAVLGGVLFAFAGYQIIWLDWQDQVGSAAAIPFGLWCAEVALSWCAREPDSPDEARTRRRALRLSVAGGGVALAAAVFGGHPETALFAGVIWGLYCLVGGIVRLGMNVRLGRWILGLGAVVVLGVGISAIELLPFAQYEGLSSRAAFIKANGVPNLAIWHKTTLPMLAFPNLFGALSHHYDSVFYAEYGTNYAELNDGFVGLVALALAPLSIAGLFVRRMRWAAVVGLGFSVIGLLFLYTESVPRLLHVLPVLGSASFSRSQDVLVLGMVTSAAVGVHWLLAGPEEGALRDWRWRVGIAAGSVFVVTALAAAGARWLRRHVETGVGGAETAAASPYVRGQIAIQVICVVAALVLMFVLLRWARHRSVTGGATLGVVAVTCVSVMLPLHGWNPAIHASLAYPVTKDVSVLKKAVGSDRSLYIGRVFAVPMTNAWFGLNDVGAYDDLGVRWHDDLYRMAFDIPQTGRGGGDIRTEQVPACSEALRLFGVQHVVGPDAASATFSDGGRLTGHSEGTPPFEVFNVPDSGFVSLVGRSAVVPGDATGLAEVTECGFQPNREVVLDPDTYRPTVSSAIPVFHGRALHGTARVVGRTAATVTVDTKASQGGWLVVRQSWFPGWKATVDGHAVTVRRADVAFQAVAVPAGSHTVTLRYAPQSVSTGVKVSVAAALLTILVVIWAAADWPPYGWVDVGRIREGVRVRRTRRAYREKP